MYEFVSDKRCSELSVEPLLEKLQLFFPPWCTSLHSLHDALFAGHS